MVWEPSLKEHVCGQCQFHTGVIIMKDYSWKHSKGLIYDDLLLDQDFALCL